MSSVNKTIYLGAMDGDEFDEYLRALRLTGAAKVILERASRECVELDKMLRHRLKGKR